MKINKCEKINTALVLNNTLLAVTSDIL